MSKIKINGAKVIILSKLREGDMSSSQMEEHLKSVHHEVTRVRIHKIMQELQSSGFVTLSKADRIVKKKADSQTISPVLVACITGNGLDVLSAYLDTDIGESISDIKERVAATITDNDKQKLERNIKQLQIKLADMVVDSGNEYEFSHQSSLFSCFDKSQLIAVEKCCIYAMKWLHGN